MKNPCRVILAIDLVCCGFIFVPTHASGQFILNPVSVTETNLGTFSPDFAPLSAMIDQSGLEFPFTNGVTDCDNYFALPNNHYSKNADHTKWQSDFSFNLPFTGTIDFDLGASYAISKAAIWNVSVKSLQFAPEVNGPFADVEGNPQGTHTVTNASLTTRGFFRTHN